MLLSHNQLFPKCRLARSAFEVGAAFVGNLFTNCRNTNFKIRQSRSRYGLVFIFFLPIARMAPSAWFPLIRMAFYLARSAVFANG